MKKYLYIFKSQLLTNLAYTANILIGFIGYFVMIFIFLNLWEYIYSDPNELINGYNMSQMVWYIIFTEILWMSTGGRKLCRKISNDVIEGNIAYNINKPYNYVNYILFGHLGDMVIPLILYTFLSLLMGVVFLHVFPSLDIFKILILLICSIFSSIISILLISCIGLLSFFIEDSGPLYWLYSKVILVFGTVFPIEFFPSFIANILRYTPVYVISYAPARLFVNFNYNEVLPILVSQLIYIAISYTIANIIYRRGVKRLNVNGG